MKKLLALLLGAVFALSPATALAEESQENLRVYGGTDFSASGEYNSSVVFAGNKLDDSAVVHGIDFAFGNEVESKGTYEYGFHAANKVEIHGNYEKDLFAFGNEISISGEAKIARDFYAAASKVEIKSSIPGSVFVAADKLILNNITIGGNLNVAARAVEIIGEVKITGVFTYNEDLDVLGNDTMVAGKLETYKPFVWSFRWGENLRIIFLILSLASSIVIAIVFILIAKKFFNQLKEEAVQADFKHVLMSLGIGLLGVIVVPIVVALLAATIVGIPAALILLFTFVIAMILSVTVSAAFVGNKIMPKQSTILSATIVLILMAVLGYIPVVGWAINSIAALIGFGIMLSMLFAKKVAQKNSSEEVKAEPEVE